MPTPTIKLNLGSSSFITTAGGYATEHLQYTCAELAERMAYGEDFIHQQNASTYKTPYTFSAKEKDAETNFSYFGARYYQADLSIWLSVDPLADKNISYTPYIYCGNNPINMIDPDGRDWYEGTSDDSKGSVMWRKGNENIDGYKNIGENYNHKIGGGVSIGYTQNKATSITTNTMSSEQWVSQYSKADWGGTPADKACNKACDAMLSNTGNSSNGSMNIIVDNAGSGRAGSANSTGFDAISKMSTALDFGNPTKVNIDFRSGSGSGDKMGDHFVLAQGKTEQIRNGKVTSTSFHCFDPGTGNRSKGTSPANILSVVNNRLEGTHMNNKKPIVATSIRPTR